MPALQLQMPARVLHKNSLTEMHTASTVYYECPLPTVSSIWRSVAGKEKHTLGRAGHPQYGRQLSAGGKVYSKKSPRLLRTQAGANALSERFLLC